MAPESTHGLFTSISTEDDFRSELGDPVEPTSGSLLYRLQNPTERSLKINYRVYTQDVVIRGAKWSTQPN